MKGNQSKSARPKNTKLGQTWNHMGYIWNHIIHTWNHMGHI